MKFWKHSTLNYFFMIAGAVLFVAIMVFMANSIKSSQVKASLTSYMDNLRDMVFMSTYDSLKKGNMKLFKSHLAEIGTFDDVQEFSLLDTEGVIHYSSDQALVKQVDPEVIGLSYQKDLQHEEFTTYYFPVETISYCSRCHPTWEIGSINSYYKLALSRKALDAVEQSDTVFNAFTMVGGVLLLSFFYLLLSVYERKKQEEQLLMSDSVRTFMESTAEPFITVDRKGNCTFCNKAGLVQLGYQDIDDLLGRNLHETIHHSHADGTVYPREECLATEEVLRVGNSMFLDETTLWRADDTNFVAEYRSHPIIKDGDIFGATVLFHDITEKKAKEAGALQLSHLASLGEMAAGVAHEINNPIGGVINYAQIFKNRYSPDEKGAELLDRIIKEGTRIASIVTSLLHYSYQGDSRVEMVSLLDVVAESMNLFQARLGREEIEIDLMVDSNVPAIRGNFQQLEQVVMNLVSNASYALNKKHPDGSNIKKKIQISIAEFPNDHWPHVRLQVRDEGTGIPEDLINKVMHPFITTKPAGDGTGLGLNVCYRIIKQHEGRIHVESKFGEFTEVTVDLPIS